MAARNLISKLIDKDNIAEEMRLINGSDTDYITANANVFKDYGNNKFLKKAVFENKYNGYLYTTISYRSGQRQRRVHILVAEAFIDNPCNYPYVIHKDNNKRNANVSNLKWGTPSENTKQAFDDGLIVNKAGWADSQSVPVCVFAFNSANITPTVYGSIREAEREIGITATAILNQCNHNVKTHPRCGYYFRYLSEYLEHGFVL